MTGNEERQKVFADIFQGTMEGIGFLRKGDTFYRCSKAGRYVFKVLAEFLPDDTLYEVTLGCASNYAPILKYRTHVGLDCFVGITEYLAAFDEEIRKKRQSMEDETDLAALAAYLEKAILPKFAEIFAPLLSGITTLRGYLKVEEHLVEQDYEQGYQIKNGACKQTALGYVALGDYENALRICRKTRAYIRDYIEMAQNNQADTEEGRETSVAAANRWMEAVLAIEKQILTGRTDELSATAAELNAQSIKACTEFFGEDLYENS